MIYRKPKDADLKLLAAMNHQLIEDEGHSNPMTLPQLEQRMRGWLRGDYQGLLFEEDGVVVAYILYRVDAETIYLRQFFVAREHRRRGVGRRAIELVRGEVWPQGRRILVEVLVRNEPGHAFWRAIGFSDYSITMEIRPS